jgi:hypothetical protein
MITSENTLQEASTYGGLVDAIGGVATVILAIIALSGVNPLLLTAVATIVFGAALLIQGGTMLTEYTKIMLPGGMESTQDVAGGGLPALFMVGSAGIVLGILALLNIVAQTLTSISVIAFGAALLLSSTSVWHLYRAKQASNQTTAMRTMSGGEVLAGEMASGSAAVQALAGMTAIVLGILAVCGIRADILTLVGLLVLGATVLLTGSTLSGAAMSFMAPTTSRATGGAWTQTGAAE